MKNKAFPKVIGMLACILLVVSPLAAAEPAPKSPVSMLSSLYDLILEWIGAASGASEMAPANPTASPDGLEAFPMLPPGGFASPEAGPMLPPGGSDEAEMFPFSPPGG